MNPNHGEGASALVSLTVSPQVTAALDTLAGEQLISRSADALSPELRHFPAPRAAQGGEPWEPSLCGI